MYTVLTANVIIPIKGAHCIRRTISTDITEVDRNIDVCIDSDESTETKPYIFTKAILVFINIQNTKIV